MCGVIGILGKQPIIELIYLGMLQLQHRGQDAAGIFLYDHQTQKHVLEKSLGSVSTFFSALSPLSTAECGIGHTRYTTSGKGGILDAQPLALQKGGMWISIAHNGNLLNYPWLRETLKKEGTHLQTTCDSETILHILANHLPEEGDFFTGLCSAIQEVYRRVSGAYSIVGVATGQGLFAFRDPRGIRPLLCGRGKDLFAFASETLPLSTMGCTSIKDLAPGQVIFIDTTRRLQQKTLFTAQHAHCCFEFNYFAKPHAVIEGKEVYSVRSKLGKFLAEKIRALHLEEQPDVVVPIPETGTPAGIALAHHLQIPLAEGFVRQAGIGRTFIMPGQKQREGAVIQKLASIGSVFAGKSVVLVDDSIVRGTVSKRTLALARQAGAKRVIFASTFPPILHPCVYGIDFPSREQLAAHDKSLAEICAEIGADALVYNDIQGLKEAIGLEDLCLACLTGNYPTSTEGMSELQKQRLEELLV